MIKRACIVLLGLTLACAARGPSVGHFGPLPSAQEIRAHRAVGCFIMEWGHWTPRSTQDSALYITPPRFVRLFPSLRVLFPRTDDVLAGFALGPDVYRWHDPAHRVLAYWEPFPRADSVALTWRIGDAGTTIVLRPISDSVWAGQIGSWYDFPSDPPRAPVRAVQTPCVAMRAHTAT